MPSKTIKSYLKSIGQKGGQQRAKNMSAKDRAIQARRSIFVRWMRERFNTTHFEDLGLPGADLIDSGLQDLVNGNLSTPNALAVAELKPKLCFLGVPVPSITNKITNSRQKLYKIFETEHKDMAHARFTAFLERLDSFCDALASTHPIPPCSTHRNRRWCS